MTDQEKGHPVQPLEAVAVVVAKALKHLDKAVQLLKEVTLLVILATLQDEMESKTFQS